jgi:ABC-type uncharacterized transport system permease subunit
VIVIPAAVEFGKLAQVVWVSLLAGIGVTAVFSLVIFGSAQSAEHRREGRGRHATAYGVLAAVAMLIVAAGVVFAITVILHKS